MKHTWKMTVKNGIGVVDLHVLDVYGSHGEAGHNGPGCTVCGFQFCHHCKNAKENWESNCPKEW